MFQCIVLNVWRFHTKRSASNSGFGAMEGMTIAAATTIAQTRGAETTDVPEVAKLSIKGVGIRSHAGVADKLFAPLADAGINIDLISTSEVRVNVLVAAEHGKRSLSILRTAFGLD